MKLVINSDYGGFSLSEKALNMYKELTGYIPYDFQRNDPILVKIVEELAEEANGYFADLKVIEIPDDVDWVLCEYDGREWVAERHRTWD